LPYRKNEVSTFCELQLFATTAGLRFFYSDVRGGEVELNSSECIHRLGCIEKADSSMATVGCSVIQQSVARSIRRRMPA
jgi:hypothetical protein